MNDEPKSILIVRLSAIGDTVLTSPIAKALREAYPTARLVWVVEEKSRDVVIGNPYLNEVVVWDRKSSDNPLYFLKKLLSLKKRLKKYSFDVAVDVQCLFKSALVAYVSGAGKRIGCNTGLEKVSWLYTDVCKLDDKYDDLSQKYLDFLRPLGIESHDTQMCFPLSAEDDAFAAEFFAENGLKNAVAFCAATTAFNKHWYNEGWSELSDILFEKYGLTPIIIGSPANVAMAEEIATGAKARVVIAAGKTTIKQAGAIIKNCRACVGVDTGFLHIARALDVPTVGIFGATEWRFFPQTDRFAWAVKPMECSPCKRNMVCKNADCMKLVTPRYVEKILSKLL